MAKRCDGGKAERQSGVTAEGRNGGMAERWVGEQWMAKKPVAVVKWRTGKR